MSNFDIEKFRNLFYSLDNDEFDQAKAMLENGIPDELIHDIVAVYLNCGDRMDGYSIWSSHDRRSPLKDLYEKYIPEDIQTIVEPYLVGVSPGQNMGGENPYWDAILIFEEDIIDKQALIEAYARINCINFRVYGEYWAPKLAELDAIPEKFTTGAVHIWSSLDDWDIEHRYPGYEDNMIKLLGEDVVAQTRQYMNSCAMLGMPLVVKNLDLYEWFDMYFSHVKLPCKDYPETLLMKAIPFIDSEELGGIVEQLGVVPFALRYQALYLWASLSASRKQSNQQLADNITNLFGITFTEASQLEQHSQDFGFLAIPLLLEDIDVKQWAKNFDEYVDIAMPCDDYPQALLAKLAPHIEVDTIRVVKTFSPKLYENDEAQQELEELFEGTIDLA